MDLFKKQRAQQVLGLAFDGRRLECVVLKRAGTSTESLASLGLALALDPLTDDPELVGRDLRNQLDKAEIRERRCVVCLPLNWALTLQTKLPAELPPADVDSFLQLEAERGFPYGLDALLVSKSIARLGETEIVATQVAVPRDHVARLEQVLRAARLVPLSFSLGLPALQAPGGPADGTVAALAVGENGIGLQITAGGGVLTLRALDNAVETEGAVKQIQTDVLARELRITLGQLPAAARAGARTLRIFGEGEGPERLARELGARMDSLGLATRRIAQLTPAEIGLSLPLTAGATPAVALAARYLAGRTAELEFLPPKISAWKQLTAKYSSKKLAYAGGAAGVVALLVILAFGWQQMQLSGLNSQWAAIAPRVREVESLQRQIKQYRPWFDDSIRTLSILRRLTEAFPEDGSVTAKNIEIRAASGITCTGTARNNEALMKMIDRLGASSEVSDIQVDQLRGASPLQFSFKFQWGERTQP